MTDYWTAQKDDLVGGFIVTNYPYPASEQSSRDLDSKTVVPNGYIIAECCNLLDAQLVANLLNDKDVKR